MKENKWQKKYIEIYSEVCSIKSLKRSPEYKMLGDVEDYIIVELAPGKKEKYKVTLDKCNMPKGLIDVETLATNLSLWAFRKLKITTM